MLPLGFPGYTLPFVVEDGGQKRPLGFSALICKMGYRDVGTQFNDGGKVLPTLVPSRSCLLNNWDLPPCNFILRHLSAPLSKAWATSRGQQGQWARPSCRSHPQGPLICRQLQWPEPGLAGPRQ